MRDAALSIRFSFSGASMVYSEDHSQLADTDLSYAADRLRRSMQKPRADGAAKVDETRVYFG